MKQLKNNKGFTLIELLVVISIISLLSSIVLSSVQDARNKARYAKFDTEFVQLRTAVELYRADKGGDYPTSFVENGSIDDLITELYGGGYFPQNNIDLPAEITYGGIYLADTSGNDLVTCGSPEPSGNKWSMYVEASKSNISKLPWMYLNGSAQQASEGSSYNYHCIEL